MRGSFWAASPTQAMLRRRQCTRHGSPVRGSASRVPAVPKAWLWCTCGESRAARGGCWPCSAAQLGALPNGSVAARRGGPWTLLAPGPWTQIPAAWTSRPAQTVHQLLWPSLPQPTSKPLLKAFTCKGLGSGEGCLALRLLLAEGIPAICQSESAMRRLIPAGSMHIWTEHQVGGSHEVRDPAEFQTHLSVQQGFARQCTGVHWRRRGQSPWPGNSGRHPCAPALQRGTVCCASATRSGCKELFWSRQSPVCEGWHMSEAGEGACHCANVSAICRCSGEQQP